jgi:predicted HTH domain antitoxin
MVVVHEYDDESVVFGRERTLDTSSSFKVDLAVRSYQKGNISLGRAAEMADLPYGKMIETLKARGVPLRFGATVEVAEKRSKKLVDKLKQIRGSSS